MAEQLNWRVLVKLNAEQTAEVLGAQYTATDERTESQQRAIKSANELAAKDARRQANLAIASGVRVRTANGVAYYSGDGQGHRAK